MVRWMDLCIQNMKACAPHNKMYLKYIRSQEQRCYVRSNVPADIAGWANVARVYCIHRRSRRNVRLDLAFQKCVRCRFVENRQRRRQRHRRHRCTSDNKFYLYKKATLFIFPQSVRYGNVRKHLYGYIRNVPIHDERRLPFSWQWHDALSRNICVCMCVCETARS